MDPFVQMGGTGETCPAASEEQIRAVIGKWADAAKRCQEAGFDGVELHFAHGFGAGGWFSPLWNHRTDQWGGSLENRARYGVEVVKAVRSAIGDWPVIAKINGEDGVEGGITLDDVVFFAGQLAETGIDALMVSGGGWRTPAIMEKHVGSTCDAFAISRPLINDPGIVNKWIENPDYLTGCISCNNVSRGRESLFAGRTHKEGKTPSRSRDFQIAATKRELPR